MTVNRYENVQSLPKILFIFVFFWPWVGRTDDVKESVSHSAGVPGRVPLSIFDVSAALTVILRPVEYFVATLRPPDAL